MRTSRRERLRQLIEEIELADEVGLDQFGVGEAQDAFFPAHSEVMTRIGRQLGWPPQTRAQFEAATGPRGRLLIGHPEEVAEKIVALHGLFRNDRILVQMAIGAMPHREVLCAIELVESRVAPLVRRQLA